MNGEIISPNDVMGNKGKNIYTSTELIEKLNHLLEQLQQNSYLKYTSNKLKQLIEDAQSPLMMIFLGKERVGKTSLINALIGRNLLSVGNKLPTYVNTFVRYGNNEYIKAIFYDGSVAHFDLKHLYLFTNSDTFLAQIIREQLSYIEVYIDCEILKNVILIDTVALETNRDGEAYYSQSLLNRVDEVFWILRNDSLAIDSEVGFLKKVHQRGIKPYFLINMKEYHHEKLQEIIQTEQNRYGEYVEEFLGVSALQAIEAKHSHNMQLLIDSHINDLLGKINRLILNREKRVRKDAIRFMHWLKQLEQEITLIPQREPYLSALSSIKNYHEEITLDITREREFKKLAEYEQEYEHVSQIMKDIQTLYQLLQTVEYENYLKDQHVEIFLELALKYHEKVREYRKLHSDYSMEYNYYEMQQKKLNKKNLVTSLFQDEEEDQSEFLSKKAESLNALQVKCQEVYESIKKLELELLNDFYNIQHHLNELVQKRLKRILNKVDYLNLERKRERIIIQQYVNKLNEFQCVVEAQEVLRNEIKPYIEQGHLPYTPEELQVVLSSIDRILQVQLMEDKIITNVEVKIKENHTDIKVDFKEKYPVCLLNLKEADIISEIPDVPDIIDPQAIQQEES